MALGKQAKILNKKQIDQLIWYVGTLRHPLRNEVIVLLSVKAGLRAKEIAGLTWAMITDADGDIAKFWSVLSEEQRDFIHCVRHAVETQIEWKVHLKV